MSSGSRLREKAKVLTLTSRALCDLTPLVVSTLLHSLHTGAACARHAPASGPLHLLFPLPNMFFLQITAWLTPSLPLYLSSKDPLPRDPLTPWLSYQNFNISLTFHSSQHCFMYFLLNIYHYSIYCTFYSFILHWNVSSTRIEFCLLRSPKYLQCLYRD